MFEKLKAFVKKAFVELLYTRSENRRLCTKIHNLQIDNADLKKSNRRYQQKNSELKKELRDYKIVRKMLGSKEVDQLLERAKNPRKERRKNHEKDFER